MWGKHYDPNLESSSSENFAETFRITKGKVTFYAGERYRKRDYAKVNWSSYIRNVYWEWGMRVFYGGNYIKKYWIQESKYIKGQGYGLENEK